MRSSALPSTIAGNSASTSSLPSQSGLSPPPPASHPHSAPCSSGASMPSPRLRLASSISRQGGSAGDKAGIRVRGHQCRNDPAPAAETARLHMDYTATHAGAAAEGFQNRMERGGETADEHA